MQGRSVKSTRNMLASFLSRTLGLVMTFVSRTIFIKVFGAEMLGISGLFTNILSFLSLADLGFSTAMTYSYYKPIAERDEAKIAALNHFYKKVYLTIAGAITAIGLVLVPFLDYFVNLEQNVDHLYLFYILTLSKTVISYLFVYKTTVLHAHQESYIVTRYNLIMEVLSVAVQIIFMLLTKNYIVYLVVAILFTFINNLYISHIADKRYPFIKNNRSLLSKDDKKGIFNNLGSVFLYKVSSVLINSTDNLIISKMVGTIYVGYYANYLTIINTASSYISITFSSLTASIGNLMVKEDENKQIHVFKEIQVLSAWFAIVIVTFVYLLINDFITIWLVNNFLLDNLTVIAIGVNFLLLCVLNPIWIFREAAGIYRKTKYIMLICAILNIGLSIVLGKLIGLSGILFASAIAKLLTYVWYEPNILFKSYFKTSPKSFFTSILMISSVTFVLCIAGYFLLSNIHWQGIPGFIIKGVICFAITNIIFLAIYGRNEYFKTLVKRIRDLIQGFLKKKA